MVPVVVRFKTNTLDSEITKINPYSGHTYHTPVTPQSCKQKLAKAQLAVGDDTFTFLFLDTKRDPAYQRVNRASLYQLTYISRGKDQRLRELREAQHQRHPGRLHGEP